ncbi:unnamed protein product [Rhizoctonia solani]|uniref:BRCT domain-containing protein n=1 Tax=Rhizoctonia solani TaxID=456999 RepID=A0A8H3H9R9_9AGAM|nr:unnamed protein product [Rhizoctonia solani]
MFKGAAWFSSSVPRHVRRLWVKNGGKKAGRGKDGIRRRLWYCFVNGPEDPKLADVKSHGLVAYHALWISDSAKLGRALPMEQYQIDGELCSSTSYALLTIMVPKEPLRPGLDVVLQSPKRRPRPLGHDLSIYSSPYSLEQSSEREMSLDFSYEADTSIEHDTDLAGVFSSPSRLSDFRTEHDSSSILSWDVTPSSTFGFDEDEEDKSHVEMLIDTEDLCEPKEGLEWSNMVADPSHQTPTPYNQASSAPFELDVSLTMSQLSSLYPHVLEGATLFLPNKEYKGKTFTASRRRRSTNASQHIAS